MLTKTSASAVARLLRSNGLMTVPPHSQDGIYVSGSHRGVSVVASVVDSTSHEKHLADEAERILREAGYGLTRSENILHVEGKVG